MIVKICDRCGKQYNPPAPFMQAKIFGYIITAFEGFTYRQVDLCSECQDDFDKWMKEKSGNGEGSE